MRIEGGQIAVITGGASGIGLGLGQAFAARGLKIVLADLREEALTSAQDLLCRSGADVLTVRTDVTDQASVMELADKTMHRFGRVDIVCNNAGVVGTAAPMWDQRPQMWRWLLDVKVMGVANGVHAFAPLLIASGTGHVLNTASVGGLRQLPQLTPYNAAMHAVVGMTETLNLELKEISAGLGASVLCPGKVATPLRANSAELAPTLVPGESTAEENAASAATGISTAEVARAALAGIEDNRVRIVVGSAAVAQARARAQSVLADLPETT